MNRILIVIFVIRKSFLKAHTKLFFCNKDIIKIYSNILPDVYYSAIKVYTILFKKIFKNQFAKFNSARIFLVI